MNIVVPIKLVPDLVEELTIDHGGASLDMTWLRLIINEFDDHAIEQAILLKERSGGTVTIIVPNFDGADDILFTAAAKGADRLIKLAGDYLEGVNNHALARAFADACKELHPDLVLTGVQAHNDLDGPSGPLLAECLGMPYVGYVCGISVSGSEAIVRKEFPGGLIAETRVTLPAVLGVQAAEQPPRYVAISKIRQVMKTAAIDEQEPASLDSGGGPVIEHMFQPESSERAAMIEGDPIKISARVIEILKEAGVL